MTFVIKNTFLMLKFYNFGTICDPRTKIYL